MQHAPRSRRFLTPRGRGDAGDLVQLFFLQVRSLLAKVTPCPAQVEARTGGRREIVGAERDGKPGVTQPDREGIVGSLAHAIAQNFGAHAEWLAKKVKGLIDEMSSEM